MHHAWLSTWRKVSQPKWWELCFIGWEFRRQFFKSPWEKCSKGVGGGEGEPGCIEVSKYGQVVWTSKVLLWSRENQISQVKEFSTLLCMGRCKSLGSLKSFFPCISWGHAPCTFSHPEFPWAHLREWLQSDSCQTRGIFLLSEHPGNWWLYHLGLLIWQETLHSSWPVVPVKCNLRNLNECSQKSRNNWFAHVLIITSLCFD